MAPVRSSKRSSSQGTPVLSESDELRLFTRGVVRLLGLILLLTVAGTIGFMATTNFGVWGSFVLTLDTIATVGSIPAPHEIGAQIVKVILIVLGVGTLFYALVTITELLVAGHLSNLFLERRARKMIGKLNDHYIICGFGRVGRQVARDLKAANARYVVIDQDATNRERVTGIGVRFLEGQPSDDELLQAAGIERARALVACVDSDAENIFITLTARELRIDLPIVARAADEDSEKKLLRAGATRVISPYKSSGTEMARLALHPQVSGRVDVATEYRLDEIEVGVGSTGAGQTIGDIRGGSVIVGLRHKDGSFAPQPPAETELQPGYVVVAMGTPRTLERLETLFEPQKTKRGHNE